MPPSEGASAPPGLVFDACSAPLGGAALEFWSPKLDGGVGAAFVVVVVPFDAMLLPATPLAAEAVAAFVPGLVDVLDVVWPDMADVEALFASPSHGAEAVWPALV